MNSKLFEAYPVFIMHEQLLIAGKLSHTYGQGLDAVWEHCILEYTMFLKSRFNSENESEYDCIVEYVNSLK